MPKTRAMRRKGIRHAPYTKKLVGNNLEGIVRSGRKWLKMTKVTAASTDGRDPVLCTVFKCKACKSVYTAYTHVLNRHLTSSKHLRKVEAYYAAEAHRAAASSASAVMPPRKDEVLTDLTAFFLAHGIPLSKAGELFANDYLRVMLDRLHCISGELPTRDSLYYRLGDAGRLVRDALDKRLCGRKVGLAFDESTAPISGGRGVWLLACSDGDREFLIDAHVRRDADMVAPGEVAESGSADGLYHWLSESLSRTAIDRAFVVSETADNCPAAQAAVDLFVKDASEFCLFVL